MKKILVLLISIAVMSCGTSKTVRDSKKVIKGNWVLNSINYSEPGTFKVTLLDNASTSCFEGSSWQFVPNNNTGLYSLSNGNCKAGSNYFVFTIDEVNAETGLYDFLLKPTNEKYKSETNKGFRLSLTALSDNAMQWQQTLSVEGKPFTITMNFTKQ